MIQIIRRDDITINITCKDSTGAALNITGYSLFFTVKSRIGDVDADAIVQKTVTSHTNPTAGLTAVVLSHSDTDIEEGDYVYDFQLIDTNGYVTSTGRDTFSVTNDVTIRTV